MKTGNTFSTIKTEGGLLPADFLRRLAGLAEGIEFLEPESYHLVRGEKIKEAISRSWNRLVGAWASFSAARDKLGKTEPGTTVTRDKWLLILFQELGYGRLQPAPTIRIEDREYKISHFWNNSPIHLVGCNVSIDKRTPGVTGAARMSPFGTVQEFLNRSEAHLWGFVSNGLKMRVLRDNMSLTRQAYLEFDLESMMAGEAYSDFAILWLICHQSRVESTRPENCVLEKWVRAAQEQGVRALENLRDGVKAAIAALGSGFLEHPANAALRSKLKSGEIKTGDYYRQLLRLVYRLLFLFAAEDRDLLLLPIPSDENAPKIRAARERYLKYYSTKRLRHISSKIRGTKHSDLFKMLCVIMRKLGGSENSPELALPALGSFLWSERAIPDIENREIDNRSFLEAIRAIGFTSEKNILRPVNYVNTDTEELGSVYESLLELAPELNVDAATFKLNQLSGNERKTTGSYYTPDTLVQSLLETALDPVIEDAMKKQDQKSALLNIRVCDPACGSGHFLIAAARRIAKFLARVESGEDEPSPEYLKHALREVIGRCIYGVDINPMTVELCKVNLWMEALEPGRPLSFLEHHIKCGNSLLGVTPKLLWGAPRKYENGKWVIFEGGIPDEAFMPIEGDDKKICSELKKINKSSKNSVQTDFFENDGALKLTADLGKEYLAMDDMDDSDLAQIEVKSRKYSEIVNGESYRRQRLICDAWCSAFVWHKKPGTGIAMTNLVLAGLRDNINNVDPAITAEIDRLRERYKFFHWHVEFPDVFKVPAKGEAAENETLGWNGGFDCVLGNPPWERIKLQEKEFFASKDPAIANAPNAAARKRMIDDLKKNDPVLFQEFCDELRKAEGESHYVRNSGMFPLCGRGDVNTYSIFAELNRNIMGPKGRAGFIVPSGIATDDTTKFFFQSLIENESLANLYDFENRQALFPGVHRSYKFSLMTLTGLGRPSKSGAELAFFLYQTEDLGDSEKVFKLSKEDIELINPNTKTCPIFRTKRDAEITKAVYRRVPVLIKEGRDGKPDENPWGIKFGTMFHMSNDSHLFRTREQLEGEGFKLTGNIFEKGNERYLPLYEAKMIHHYNHRWASSNADDEREMDAKFYANPNNVVMPRYWVAEEEVEKSLNEKWNRKWLIGFRDITNTTNERTTISCIWPRYGAGDTFLQMFPGTNNFLIPNLMACLNSYALDYVTRQKVGGVHLKYHYFKQLPVISPKIFNQSCKWNITINNLDWFLPRVLELVYTAYDLKSFALDCGYSGPPFKWDEERRFLIRCELDAAYFHLYEISRDDVDYIMDTFPIVCRKDQDKYGYYRTKKVILEIFDEMAEAIKTGKAYQTKLNPPPGDPRAAHNV